MKKLIFVATVAALAASSYITVFWVGSEDLVDSVAYPDGTVLDITMGETYFEFVLIRPDDTIERNTSPYSALVKLII